MWSKSHLSQFWPALYWTVCLSTCMYLWLTFARITSVFNATSVKQIQLWLNRACLLPGLLTEFDSFAHNLFEKISEQLLSLLHHAVCTEEAYTMHFNVRWRSPANEELIFGTQCVTALTTSTCQSDTIMLMPVVNCVTHVWVFHF